MMIDHPKPHLARRAAANWEADLKNHKHKQKHKQKEKTIMDEIVIREDVPFPEKTQERKGRPSSPHTLVMEKLKPGQSFETGPFSHEEAKEQSKILSGNAANTHRRKYFNQQWRLRTTKRFDIDTEEYFVGVWCGHKDSFTNKTNRSEKKGESRG